MSMLTSLPSRRTELASIAMRINLHVGVSFRSCPFHFLQKHPIRRPLVLGPTISKMRLRITNADDQPNGIGYGILTSQLRPVKISN